MAANFNIWMILCILAVISLAIFWRSRNAVWGGLTLGVIAGFIIAAFIFFQGNGFNWFIVGKSAISGVLIGVFAELLGRASGILKKKFFKGLLLVFGILLMIAGFLHQHAKDFPNICNFLSGDYYQGTQALNKLMDTTKLESERVIIREDSGFNVLLDLFIEKDWIRTGANISDKASVVEFRGVGNYGKFELASVSTHNIMIFVKTGKGAEAVILSSQIQAFLEELLDRKLFSWGISLLVLGVIIAVIGYLID